MTSGGSAAAGRASHPAIERIVAALERRPFVEEVVLFGSRAVGDAGPRSDIDLAVRCPAASARDWFGLVDAVEEEGETLLEIDLVRLDEAPAELVRQIREEGITLYERP